MSASAFIQRSWVTQRAVFALWEQTMEIAADGEIADFKVIQECLKEQLAEIEMLQSMYADELDLEDESVLQFAQFFIDSSTKELPACISFNIRFCDLLTEESPSEELSENGVSTKIWF